MTRDIIAQGFGILGLIFSALSFQEKNNKKFFVKQGLSGLMFAVNYIMIGAVAAGLINITNLIRGTILSKDTGKGWQIILIEALYSACFLSTFSKSFGNPMQIFLSIMAVLTALVMSFFMWRGDGKHIRYVQILFVSPVWLFHNIINFTLGGIICEILAMSSVVISFVRFGKDGFESSEVER